MASTRIPILFEENEQSEILTQKRKNQEKILDLTLSNPTVAGFNYPVPVAYEADPQGMFEARKAVCTYWRKNLSPEQMFLTASTSEAYAALIKLFCEPGDEVLIPTPSYPLIEHLVRLEGCVPIKLDLFEAEGWFLDLGEAAKRVSDRSKLLIWVQPNNPTGHYLNFEHIQALVDFAKTFNLALISDEVFFEYRLLDDNSAPSSFLDVPAPAIPLVVLGGFSKLLGLPHHKLSWGYFHAEFQVIARVMPRLLWILDMYLSVSFHAQTSVEKVFKDHWPVQQEIIERVKRNLFFLKQEICKNSELTLVSPEAGWNAILKMPSHVNEEAFGLRILNEHHLLVYPGHMFEMPFTSSVVVSLLVESEVFQTGLGHIINTLSKIAADHK